MDINSFAKKICEKEGLKKQVDIAQVKEILRVANGLTKGDIYYSIKFLSKK